MCALRSEVFLLERYAMQAAKVCFHGPGVQQRCKKHQPLKSHRSTTKHACSSKRSNIAGAYVCIPPSPVGSCCNVATLI